MATMNSGLGGPAGYGENVFSSTTKALGDNDDGSVQVNVTSVFSGGIDFFGTNYTNIYINSNGLISFGSPNADFYAGGGPGAVNLPAIVPFWSDVDITKGGEIYWDFDTTNGTITITWDGVARFSGAGNNSFQVVLTDTGGGDFDVEVIYEDIQWSGSSGDPAAATGITDGDTYTQEFDGSGSSVELLNYETNDFGGGDPAGTYTVPVENGFPEGEWTEHGGHAARFLFATVSRPSRTAALVTATR